MDKVETHFERIEIALEVYRQSLKDKEDEPGQTAIQYAKDATQDTKLRLNIRSALDSLKKLEVQLPSEDRLRVLQRRQALQQEYAGLAYHHLSE